MVLLFGGKMTLFSRSFIRKRAIYLATTASVAATSLVMVHGPGLAHRVRATMPIQYVADQTDNSAEPSFMSENESAMSKMMTDMTGMMVKPTGDIDRDFVAMMVPHHQGAVDLAQAELKYGHNERLRRLAQQIIANRQSEIAVMRLAVDDEQPLPAGSTPQSVPPSDSPAASHATMGIAHDAKPHN
jgi:RES domain-containing protein